MTTIVWFRQDLRLADNPALHAACARGEVVPVYILDEGPGVRPMGGASRWWLERSLASLAESLGGLVLRRGEAREALGRLLEETGAGGVYWNRCYEPWAVARDKDLKEWLRAAGVEAKSFGSALMHEPWEVRTGAGTDFKVFTPFWKACLQAEVAKPLPAPKAKLAKLPQTDMLGDWRLYVPKPDWAKGWEDTWTPGEDGATARLEAFLKDGLAGYAAGRDAPGGNRFSRLSAPLHFGEVSPRQVWARVRAEEARRPPLAKDAEVFLKELGWREFAHHVLFHFPALAEDNWKAAFDAYPWRADGDALAAWQQGRTGYPLVDAGMRELWATGFMHNRARMVAASFLVKHLRIDWREGERWFWDTLVDADLANNAFGWQWVAGSGADASPYFRVFNPFMQGFRFDGHGDYTRRWVPELAELPDEHLHAPGKAPEGVLRMAGVELGRTYPMPIVDHDEARAAALAGHAMVKNGD